MVILPEFCMWQPRDGDHREDALHFWFSHFTDCSKMTTFGFLEQMNETRIKIIPCIIRRSNCHSQSNCQKNCLDQNWRINSITFLIHHGKGTRSYPYPTSNGNKSTFISWKCYTGSIEQGIFLSVAIIDPLTALFLDLRSWANSDPDAINTNSNLFLIWKWST